MEKIDVLDENGNKTNQAETSDSVHRKGFWHRAVHIWFINSKGELLLQKRSAKKKSHPNEWDISAAGHVSAGQTPLEAALREIQEETGMILKPSDLEFLFTQKHAAERKDYVNNEFDDVYLVKREIEVEALTFHPDEIAEFKLMPWRELKDKIETGDPGYVPHGQYKKLFEIIEQKGY